MSKQQDQQKTQQVVLSDISNVAEKFLENTEILKLKKDIAEKDAEITHLKQLLLSRSPLIGQAEPLILTDEEIIAVKQLERLKKLALERELTLDEVKRMDLLVKNKRLAQGNSTNINGEKKDTLKDLSPAKLIEIASKKIIEE